MCVYVFGTYTIAFPSQAQYVNIVYYYCILNVVSVPAVI